MADERELSVGVNITSKGGDAAAADIKKVEAATVKLGNTSDNLATGINKVAAARKKAAATDEGYLILTKQEIKHAEALATALERRATAYKLDGDAKKYNATAQRAGALRDQIADSRAQTGGPPVIETPDDEPSGGKRGGGGGYRGGFVAGASRVQAAARGMLATIGSHAIGTMGRFATVLGALGPVGIAVGGAITGLVVALKLLHERSKEVLEIQQALAKTGDSTPESFQKVTEAANRQAASVGGLSKVWEDVSIALLGAGADTNQLPGLLKDVENLAGIMNGDLKGATEVIKAAIGNDREAFAKFNVVLKDGIPILQQWQDVSKQLAEQGAGLLADKTKELSGSLKSIYEDLKRTGGALVGENEFYKSMNFFFAKSAEGWKEIALMVSEATGAFAKQQPQLASSVKQVATLQEVTEKLAKAEAELSKQKAGQKFRDDAELVTIKNETDERLAQVEALHKVQIAEIELARTRKEISPEDAAAQIDVINAKTASSKRGAEDVGDQRTLRALQGANAVKMAAIEKAKAEQAAAAEAFQADGGEVAKKRLDGATAALAKANEEATISARELTVKEKEIAHKLNIRGIEADAETKVSKAHTAQRAAELLNADRANAESASRKAGKNAMQGFSPMHGWTPAELESVNRLRGSQPPTAAPEPWWKQQRRLEGYNPDTMAPAGKGISAVGNFMGQGVDNTAALIDIVGTLKRQQELQARQIESLRT